VRIFTKSTAIQHAKDKIRSQLVHPGPIATDMIKDVAREQGRMGAAPAAAADGARGNG
jgi:NAD(P)-dependent dehydrogenase (short-subunit alcohol dehydrogenase family)